MKEVTAVQVVFDGHIDTETIVSFLVQVGAIMQLNVKYVAAASADEVIKMMLGGSPG